MDYIALAELLFPNVNKTTEYYEDMYPERVLPEGAKVTRFAPSPTGFVHFGGLFPVLVDVQLARQSGGVCYLRIEDTDSKREVKGAELDIINAFKAFGISFDESIVKSGAYGPYRQSERKEIYHTFAKKLVAEGKAYPCFCSQKEMEDMRKLQKSQKETTGYYGKYTKCRDLTLEQVKNKLDSGMSYVLRLKSFGNSNNKIKFTDLIKGTIEITENDIDHILLKSDGMPDYHLAHAVDDHLMRTTHVVRGEEWLPSLPYHIQLFAAFGFKLPKYMHIAQLMRLDGTSKKKLSKRDKGAGLTSYISDGYAPKAVIEYVLTLLNSNFEDWRRANPDADVREFPFSIKKMSASGALFDLIKLNDVSKNVLSRMTTEQIYDRLTEWAKVYDKKFYGVLTRQPDFTLAILSIGRGGPKARKDFGRWDEVKPFIGFFFKEYFKVTDQPEGDFKKDDIKNAITEYLSIYNPEDDKETWFEKIKVVAEKTGFCPSTKDYKQNPEGWKGHVGDTSMFIRLAITGRLNSPDLFTVMQILGGDECKKRLKNYLKNI
ncbi:MAG TPA: glutamate--tRNA ligase [Clostridiales bacterium]|nr:glutamate--tRNA ligase [Clostridiales bacterium]